MKQHIVQFKITMDDVVFVDIGDALDNLSHDYSSLRLAYLVPYSQ